MAINDLIPGSLAWMLFNMRSVHPVYNNINEVPIDDFIIDESSNQLTTEIGDFIIAESGTGLSFGDLYRWI